MKQSKRRQERKKQKMNTNIVNLNSNILELTLNIHIPKKEFSDWILKTATTIGCL